MSFGGLLKKNCCFIIWYNMHIKSKWSKTYVFFYEIKNFGAKGKFLKFNGYPCKNVTKYFGTFFCFRTFCIFFSFTDRSVTNSLFVLRLPLISYIVVRACFVLPVFILLPSHCRDKRWRTRILFHREI